MQLLDTNVISELRKVRAGMADARVVAWANTVEASDLYLSVITLQELAIGVLLAERRDPTQGASLRAWFEHQVQPAFEGRVLHVGSSVALRSAPLHVSNPHPVRDGLVAATALVHGRPLSPATRPTSPQQAWPCSIRGNLRPDRGFRAQSTLQPGVGLSPTFRFHG